jgi:hypothetical protein
MLFEYEDNDDGSTLVWCQGRVVAFIKESIDKHVYVKIEWSDKCVRDGDLKITRNQLKKTKFLIEENITVRRTANGLGELVLRVL